MKFNLEKLVRDNIKRLTPYSSARHEFKGEAAVFLDANENAYGTPLPEGFNRYPDPLQWQLKAAVSKIKNIDAGNIFVGNGSDEVIDLAYRIFCEPGKDNVIVCPPTYGMYEVSAGINDIEVRKVLLTQDFQLDTERILQVAGENTKLLFICSPNNPTGNSMQREHVEKLVENFSGIVIIDEAYIDFSDEHSFLPALHQYPNLVVMQTLSKAWGLASLRLGLAFTSVEIIQLFNKVKPPYNINKSSQELATRALQNARQVKNWVAGIIEQREKIAKELSAFPFVRNIYPSDANFLLVRVDDANHLYNYLSTNGVIVRNRSKEPLCDNCLRITIGTPGEDEILLNALKKY